MPNPGRHEPPVDIMVGDQIIVAGDAGTGQTIIYADINATALTAATPAQLFALVAAKKFYILELYLTFTVQGIHRLLDTTGTPVYRATWQTASYGAVAYHRNANDKAHFVTTVAQNLGIVSSVNNSVSGSIVYYNAT
ncbi:MAG: hypothetical protein ABIG61_17825 [Planctomycetota bacterium]